MLRDDSPERPREQHSFGTLQCDPKLRCYHDKSNAIQKENFNKDTAEKFHSVRIERREVEGGEKHFLNGGDKDAGDKKVRVGGLKVPVNPKLSDRYRKANT